jgi:hypothetical protein
MAIVFKTLENAVSTTNSEGVESIEATVDEKSLIGGATTILGMPFKISEDSSYVNSSMAGAASITWGFVLAHVVDYIHASNGADPVSPITGLYVSQD